ncbi:MAG TPA: saccharopine dehydrogenase NADP-binding domain-containing protein [Polyangiaceae bacterium]|nr:saccharopine dehydrogenase NADP-binding domain-containing protein [Polyangiaceae bacterium]
MKPIVVFGASGFTGRLIVQALLQLGEQNVVLGGRNSAKLEQLSQKHGGLEYRVADARDPDSLAALLRGAGVVVSAAGPFLQYGDPLVRAAISARAHFLDTTGEQAYMLRILERYQGACRDRQLCVVNAQTFEFAIGYCVSALLAETHPALDTIDVFNRVHGVGTTRSTQKSALLALGSAAFIRKRGRLVKRGLSLLPWVRMPGSSHREPTFPFPGGEALHLVRPHPQVKNVTTNLVLPPALAPVAMWSARPVLGLLDKTAAHAALFRGMDSAPEGPSESVREKQGFHVLARGRGATDAASILASGVDPYGITGVIAALGARMLSQAAPRATGVVSTDQAFGARHFLDALSGFGVQVSRQG